MRNVLAAFLLLGLAATSARAQSFRVVTWQVPDFQLSKLTNGTPVVEPPQLATIASALGRTDADAIILYGISDGSTLKRLAESITPKKHSVAIHTVFRQSSGSSKSPIIGLPIGILTRRERMSSRKMDWNDTGRIDLNGGFVFATIRHNNEAMGIYVATLPGPLTNGIGTSDGSYFSRKRDYAADFLGHHTAFVAATYEERQYATFLTGDINLDSKKPVKDACTALLEKAGFRAVPVGPAQDKSTLPITAGPLLNRVFDPVFTKNVEFMATRQVPVAGFELPMVICEVTIKPSGSAAVSKPARKPAPAREREETLPPVDPVPAPPRVQLAAVPVPASPAARTSAPAQATAITSNPPVPARASAAVPPVIAATKIVSAPGTPPWVWPVAISGMCGLVAVIILNTRAAKRRQSSAALGRPMFVELNSPSRSSRSVTESASGAVLSEPTTATDNAHNSAWQTPSVRLNSTESEPKPQNDPKAALVPHLRQLMREKLFQWLSNQRSQLLDSHENGTAQVRGLEERLGKIRDQFQDKLVAQEQRIAEMDRELREKERLLKQSPKIESQSDQANPLN
ncbi:MAG: hypothetical protein IPK15_21435 [Verrucomicrobia bacterium]|nr:hypothetical protein [Verrucomicrobiota bacterium]